MCMPMVFWAAQTMAAYGLLEVREPKFMSYISPTSAATTVQLAYPNYVKQVVRQHCVAVSGANATAIAQQTPMDALIALVNANTKAFDATAKAVTANAKAVDATTTAVAALVASLARPLQTFDNG